LYYLSFTTENSAIDGVRRIRYTGATNQRPTAQISVSPQSGPLSTTYTFSAVGTTDPENNAPFTYTWDFGDGSPIVNTGTPTTTHVYSTAQNYATTLTVTDLGSPPATSIPVTVTVYPGNTAPSGTISLTNTTDNSRTTTYYAGDGWDYQATNLSDDTTLPANAVTWEIVFHHQLHTHPFIPLATDDHGHFDIPYTGELDPVVWYRVHMFITDSRGQKSEVIKDILPVTKVLTFTTSPSSGKVTIEGATFATPLTRTRVVGMHFALTVPSPQTIWNMSPFTFNSWSQGGTKSQTIIVPPVDTTYVANFNAPANAIPPKNYFTTATPTLSWNRITTAIRYVLQVANNNLFTGATTYQVGNVLSYTLPTTADGLYYWHVAACPTVSTCGAYSTTDTFVVDGP
jgi:hypothetical protein